MTKQGVRWKTWKRRLFILDIRNKRLSYYQDPQVRSQTSSHPLPLSRHSLLSFSPPKDTIPKGHVGLEGYSVVDDDGVIKKPFSFLLIKDGSRFAILQSSPPFGSFVDFLYSFFLPLTSAFGLP